MRIYVFERSQHEDADNEEWSPFERMPPEQQLQLLHNDFGTVWEMLSNRGYDFHHQNTLLVGSEKDRLLCSDNVLSVSTWTSVGDGADMQAMEERLESFFRERPLNVTAWMNPRVQVYNI